MAAEFMLKGQVVGDFGGCGVQLNNNVFAKQTTDQHVLPASFADLKDKVRKLEPQFVRIFYNDKHAGVPVDPEAPTPVDKPQEKPGQVDRWKSFTDVVALAQDANAVINITWQGGEPASAAHPESMERFANVLAMLAKGGTSKLRWATIANEPNTVPGEGETKLITVKVLAEMYRLLDGFLRQRGVRKQIGLMAGDVIEGPRNKQFNRLHQPSPFNQLAWLKYLSRNLPGIIDAYSVHIYWNCTETSKLQRRLREVRNVIRELDRERSLSKPMRIYVTEFGARGVHIDKDGGTDPGDFHDKTTGKDVAISDSNVAPFQHAMFMIRAAQLGYSGLSKWDCYYGRYDLLNPAKGAPPKGNQQYFAIDKPKQGKREWQLLPMYYLLRLFTVTTERGWNVRLVAPTTGARQLVAFQGAGSDLTIFGLSFNGAQLNRPSGKLVPYTIGGLPKQTSFRLLFWNRAGGGKLVVDPAPFTTNGSGEVMVKAPEHSVFALTTKALPANLV